MTQPPMAENHPRLRRRPGLKHVMKNCGHRDGDWRAILAREIAVENRRKYSFPLDRQTLRLIHIYRYELGRGPLNKTHHAFYSTFCGAREILTDRIQRLTMEAGIISRLPSPEIAERLGISLDIVNLYEAAFFDVRQHLNVSTVFAAHVPRPAEVDSERNVVLKVAHEVGFNAARDVIERLQFFGLPHDLTTPEGRTRELIELLLLACETAWNSSELNPAKLTAQFCIGQSMHSTTPSVSDLLRPTVLTQLTQIWSAAAISMDSEKVTEPIPVDQKFVAYYGGPTVLQWVMDGVDGSRPQPSEPADTAAGWITNSSRRCAPPPLQASHSCVRRIKTLGRCWWFAAVAAVCRRSSAANATPAPSLVHPLGWPIVNPIVTSSKLAWRSTASTSSGKRWRFPSRCGYPRCPCNRWRPHHHFNPSMPG